MLVSEAKIIAKETGLIVSDFSVETKEKKPYDLEMKKTNEGKCVFLKDNRCNIYSSRPLICRFYPFQLTYEIDVEKYVFDFTLECPAINQGKLLSRKDFEMLFELARHVLS
jgi:Fe-S-cluster containining protein